SEFVLNPAIGAGQADVGGDHGFRELACGLGDGTQGSQIGFAGYHGSRRQIKTVRDVVAIDHAVMPHDGIIAYRAIEEHRIETDEDAAAHAAGPVHDGPVGNGGVFSDGDGGTVLGMNDDAVLDIGVCTNDNGLHVAVFVYLISANDCIGADENVGIYPHEAAQYGGRINKGGFMDDRIIATGVSSEHKSGPIKTMEDEF